MKRPHLPRPKLPRLRLPRWRRRERPTPRAPENRAIVLAAIPVALVALMAGKVSYSHITALGMRTQQGYTDSHLLAVPIDGLIVAGSVLLAFGSSLGWLGVTLGVAATLFANLQFGLPHGALSAVVSTWPAIAFSVACFMLERWLRSRRGRSEPAAEPAAQSAPGVPSDNLDAAIQKMMLTNWAGNALSARQLQTQFALPWKSASKVRQLVLAEANGHLTGEAPEGGESP